MTEFDPDVLLNTTVTDDEYEGKRPRTPEGSYPSCTITDVRAYEPHDKAKEKGIEARLLVNFECPSFDGDLSTYINYKRPLSAKATYMKLLKALWPNKAVALTKSSRDMIGETVDVTVFHESGDFGDWDEFRFTPSR
jgi:hypothetical protein